MADVLNSAREALENGASEAALKGAEQALSKFRAAGDAEGIVDAVKTLVPASVAVDKLEDTKLLVKDVMAEFKASGSRTGQASMLLATAELSVAGKEADKALALVQDIEDIISGTAQSQELEQQLLKLQVNAYLVKSSGNEAMTAAKDLRALATKTGDKEGEAAAWQAVASVYQLQEQDEADRAAPADALSAAEKAVSLYKEIGNRKGEATALNTIARANLRQDKVAKGLQAAQDALEAFRQLGQSRGMVSALETIVQANSMKDNPMAGLQIANKELEMIRRSGNKRGEADILEMIAQTHAMLGQPASARSVAEQAKQIYSSLGDHIGQGSMFHTLSEMARSQGDMAEATKFAEASLRCFKSAGCSWGEEQAMQTLSTLWVERGHPEKSPKRGDVQQALKDLQRAIQGRKAEDVKAAEERLNGMGGLLGEGEVQGMLVPLLQKDPSAIDFLEEQGWQFEREKVGAAKIMQYPHKGFYLNTIMTGMNFGPQFRSVNPYRAGTPGKDATCMSVTQLPETEAWQMDLGYRPGVLDSGLQVQGCLGFP